MCGAQLLEAAVSHCDADCEAANNIRSIAKKVNAHPDYRTGVHNTLDQLVHAGILGAEDVAYLEQSFDELPEEDKPNALAMLNSVIDPDNARARAYA